MSFAVSQRKYNSSADRSALFPGVARHIQNMYKMGKRVGGGGGEGNMRGLVAAQRHKKEKDTGTKERCARSFDLPTGWFLHARSFLQILLTSTTLFVTGSERERKRS
jgi:hypothetical protein